MKVPASEEDDGGPSALAQLDRHPWRWETLPRSLKDARLPGRARREYAHALRQALNDVELLEGEIADDARSPAAAPLAPTAAAEMAPAAPEAAAAAAEPCVETADVATMIPSLPPLFSAAEPPPPPPASVAASSPTAADTPASGRQPSWLVVGAFRDGRAGGVLALKQAYVADDAWVPDAVAAAAAAAGDNTIDLYGRRVRAISAYVAADASLTPNPVPGFEVALAWAHELRARGLLPGALSHVAHALAQLDAAPLTLARRVRLAADVALTARPASPRHGNGAACTAAAAAAVAAVLRGAAELGLPRAAWASRAPAAPFDAEPDYEPYVHYHSGMGAEREVCARVLCRCVIAADLPPPAPDDARAPSAAALWHALEDVRVLVTDGLLHAHALALLAAGLRRNPLPRRAFDARAAAPPPPLPYAHADAVRWCVDMRDWDHAAFRHAAERRTVSLAHHFRAVFGWEGPATAVLAAAQHGAAAAAEPPTVTWAGPAAEMAAFLEARLAAAGGDEAVFDEPEVATVMSAFRRISNRCVDPIIKGAALPLLAGDGCRPLCVGICRLLLRDDAVMRAVSLCFRGRLWERLDRDLDALGRGRAALDACYRGLEDPDVICGDRVNLQDRRKRLAQLHMDSGGTPPTGPEREEEVTIHSDYVLKSGVRKCRKRLFQKPGAPPTDPGITVEAVALEHFRALGWDGAHSEYRMPRAFTSMLLADAMWDPHYGRAALPHPYLPVPLDMMLSTLYRRRRPAIDAALDRIAALNGEPLGALVAAAWDRIRPMAWTGLLGPMTGYRRAHFVRAARGLGGRRLAALVRLFVSDTVAYQKGVPDLLLWRGDGEAMFVEVKFEDGLRVAQRAWLRELRNMGIPALACRIDYS